MLKVGDKLLCKESYCDNFIKGRLYTIIAIGFNSVRLQGEDVYEIIDTSCSFYIDKDEVKNYDELYLHKYFCNNKEERKKKLERLIVYEDRVYIYM